MQKINKYIWLLVLVVLSYSNKMEAQCEEHGCDPQIAGMEFDMSCVEVNQTAKILLTWAIGGGDASCVTPSGSWKIQISLPSNFKYGVESAEAVDADQFTWIYNEELRTLDGVISQDMSYLASGQVVVTVTGVEETECANQLSSANIQLIPNFLGGCLESFTNNTANDAASAGAGVQPASALPVDLVSFTARKQGSTSKLEWATTSEINSERYDIMRSIDGRNYEAIGKVSAAGNSSSREEYEYIDESPSLGVNYYQLRQVDRDGSRTMSDVRTVNFEGGKISISPNPTVGMTQISLPVEWTKASWTLEVYNSSYQLVRKEQVGAGSTTRYDLDMESYESGIYVVRMISGETVVNKEIIKAD